MMETSRERWNSPHKMGYSWPMRCIMCKISSAFSPTFFLTSNLVVPFSSSSMKPIAPNHLGCHIPSHLPPSKNWLPNSALQTSKNSIKSPPPTATKASTQPVAGYRNSVLIFQVGTSPPFKSEIFSPKAQRSRSAMVFCLIVSKRQSLSLKMFEYYLHRCIFTRDISHWNTTH